MPVSQEEVRLNQQLEGSVCELAWLGSAWQREGVGWLGFGLVHPEGHLTSPGLLDEQAAIALQQWGWPLLEQHTGGSLAAAALPGTSAVREEMSPAFQMEVDSCCCIPLLADRRRDQRTSSAGEVQC